MHVHADDLFLLVFFTLTICCSLGLMAASHYLEAVAAESPHSNLVIECKPYCSMSSSTHYSKCKQKIAGQFQQLDECTWQTALPACNQ